MTTLKERLAELSAGRPRGTQAELARRCGIEPASVSDWFSGKTKSIDGKYLTTVAEFFGVESHWLSTGKHPTHYKTEVDAAEYSKFQETPKPFTGEAMRLAEMFDQIPESDLIRRAQAYIGAMTVIVSIVEGRKQLPIEQPNADQKKLPL